MGRELRVDDLSHAEKLLGARKIIEIGHGLARKYRVIGKTPLLRPLDFGVPITPFYEPQHHTAIVATRRRGNVIDHRQGALLVGLNRETEPVPSRERWIGQQQIDNIKRKLKPVG